MSIEIPFTSVVYNRSGYSESIESSVPMTISEWMSKFPVLKGLEINKKPPYKRVEMK